MTGLDGEHVEQHLIIVNVRVFPSNVNRHSRLYFHLTRPEPELWYDILFPPKKEFSLFKLFQFNSRTMGEEPSDVVGSREVDYVQERI